MNDLWCLAGIQVFIVCIFITLYYALGFVVKFHLYSLHVDGVDRVGGDHSFVLLEGEHQVEEVEGPRVAPLGGQRGGVETLRLRGVHLATQSVTYQPPLRYSAHLLPVLRRHAQAVEDSGLQGPAPCTLEVILLNIDHSMSRMMASKHHGMRLILSKLCM